MRYLTEVHHQLDAYVRDYPDILKGYLNIEALLDMPGAFVKGTLQIIEETRVKSFVYRIIKGRMSNEEFVEKFKEYGNKKQLMEIIERQRRSHSEIINILCAVIIEDDFLNNNPFSHLQLNHINFLLGLMSLDLYNLLQIYKINNFNNGQGISRMRYMELELGSVIKFKLDNGGYTTAGSGQLSDLDGNIHLTDTFDDLMTNRILKHFSIEDLEHIIMVYN